MRRWWAFIGPLWPWLSVFEDGDETTPSAGTVGVLCDDMEGGQAKQQGWPANALGQQVTAEASTDGCKTSTRCAGLAI